MFLNKRNKFIKDMSEILSYEPINQVISKHSHGNLYQFEILESVP
jgi:hypothetical protein